MTKVKRRYDKEFKVQAIKMVLDGGLSKAEAGRKLGVNQTMIGNWIRAFQAGGQVAFPGRGRLNPLEDELRKLRQEVKELRMETEFLKKSAAYFASLKR